LIQKDDAKNTMPDRRTSPHRERPVRINARAAFFPTAI